MGFRARSIRHEQYCQEIHSVLNEKGFKMIPFGIEHRFPRECHAALMQYRENSLSKFARFVPDYILVGRHGLEFFDVKSPSGVYKNIAIELDAMDNYQTLAGCGMPVFIVARDYMTFWAADVVFSKIFKDGIKLGNNKGSGTPFGIVDLSETKHSGLLDFVSIL